MDTLKAHEAKDQLDNLVENVLQENNKYRISTPQGNAILLSEKTYDDLMITLELLSTPLLMQDEHSACCMESDTQRDGNCCN